jgi:hypothetical protein
MTTHIEGHCQPHRCSIARALQADRNGSACPVPSMHLFGPLGTLGTLCEVEDSVSCASHSIPSHPDQRRDRGRKMVGPVQAKGTCPSSCICPFLRSLPASSAFLALCTHQYGCRLWPRTGGHARRNFWDERGRAITRLLMGISKTVLIGPGGTQGPSGIDPKPLCHLHGGSGRGQSEERKHGDRSETVRGRSPKPHSPAWSNLRLGV